MLFGVLGVNDVIVVVMCVLFMEYIIWFICIRKKIFFIVVFVNNFKMGFIYGFFIDVFKLVS